MKKRWFLLATAGTLLLGCHDNGTEVFISPFDSSSSKVLSSSSSSTASCATDGYSSDAHTLLMENFDSSKSAGSLVQGVCGKAISLNEKDYVTLSKTLDDSIPEGTLEFWFRPHSGFYNEDRALLGTDQARLSIFYADSTLYFAKNITNQYIYVSARVLLNTGWNFIAAQWGDGEISLYLNGLRVAEKSVSGSGYQPYPGGSDPFIVGYKSNCCLTGIGIREPLYTSGDFDLLRISSIQRY